MSPSFHTFNSFLAPFPLGGDPKKTPIISLSSLTTQRTTHEAQRYRLPGVMRLKPRPRPRPRPRKLASESRDKSMESWRKFSSSALLQNLAEHLHELPGYSSSYSFSSTPSQNLHPFLSFLAPMRKA